MEDWARWGRHHERGGTHAHAANNVAVASAAAQAAAVVGAARRARATGRRRHDSSTSRLATPRSGRWVLAVVPAAPGVASRVASGLATGGLRNQHHRHHRRDFSGEQPHTPSERGRVDDRSHRRPAAGVDTGFGAPVSAPDHKHVPNSGAVPRPTATSSRTMASASTSARTRRGTARGGDAHGQPVLTSRQQAIEDRYHRRVAQRAAARMSRSRSRRGRELRQ